jgi:hypothetical protein
MSFFQRALLFGLLAGFHHGRQALMQGLTQDTDLVSAWHLVDWCDYLAATAEEEVSAALKSFKSTGSMA